MKKLLITIFLGIICSFSLYGAEDILVERKGTAVRGSISQQEINNWIKVWIFMDQK